MISYDDLKHEYRLNGVVVPSVTQVIKAAGLVNFDGVNELVMERSAKFGTAVHKAIELECKGRLDHKSLAESIKPYLAQWNKFCADFNYVSKLVEQRGVNERMRFGYCIDNIGNIEASTVMVDLKTGAEKSADIIQASAYNYTFPVNRVFLLYISSDGYKVKELDRTTKRRGEQLFISALSIYNYRKEMGLL